MTRSRRSAKTVATAFETLIAEALAEALNDDRIERRTRNGQKDRGDISGIRINGHRLVLEAKNVNHQYCPKCKRITGLKLPEWTSEARIEAGNDDALAGLVISKRKGTTDPLQQWVHCTVAELVALITGQKVPQ